MGKLDELIQKFLFKPPEISFEDVHVVKLFNLEDRNNENKSRARASIFRLIPIPKISNFTISRRRWKLYRHHSRFVRLYDPRRNLMIKKIKLMAEYHYYPLWDLEEPDNINPAELPLRKETIKQLLQWAKNYDNILKLDDPESSNFASQEDAQAFEAEETSPNSITQSQRASWLCTTRLVQELKRSFLVPNSILYKNYGIAKSIFIYANIFIREAYRLLIILWRCLRNTFVATIAKRTHPRLSNLLL